MVLLGSWRVGLCGALLVGAALPAESRRGASLRLGSLLGVMLRANDFESAKKMAEPL